jgi:O-acetyl-ADP-ribose deacetylase (regulator of RNase III)
MLNFIEETGDIFDLQDYCYAHCVSSCFTMGKGIAKIFKDRYGKVDQLKEQLSNKNNKVGEVCWLENENNKIYYLVTKDKYYNKPTYKSITQSLLNLKSLIIQHKVDKLAMPKIACGLDQKKWSIVRSIIIDIFKDVDDLRIVIRIY